MSLVASFAPPARGAARRRRAASTRCAAAQSAGAAHPLGSCVRVKDAVTVYHVPKAKAGLSLQGVVGTVERYSDLSPEGALLSSTQPLVVRFEVPGADGKTISFASHLTCDEVEAVAGGAGGASAAGGAGGAASTAAGAGGASGAYAAQLAAGDVVQVTSEEEFDAILASTDKLVVLDAAATWCGPCKVFKPHFEKVAKDYAGRALFISCMGDSNASTAKIMKRLAIKAVPCFIGFRSGANKFQFSGANKELLAEKLVAHV